jgi:serine/threonine-protein kinase
MSTYTPCPDRSRLDRFLTEDLPAEEDAALSGHIAACRRCQETLDEITGAPEPWARLARELGSPGGAPSPALRRTMSALTAIAPGPEAVEGPPAEEVVLDFLSPADQPGCLGHLGRYEVRRVIGRGGMGVVLEAFDPGLRRRVAIKLLAPHLASSPRARQNFLREARAAAAVNHENVITIHDVDESAGLPYLVMHYVAGRSLEQRLGDGVPIELPEVVRLGRQVAAGLAAAHGRGLIHRDVKPANILLEITGVDLSDSSCSLEGRGELERVLLTDFGLARAVDDGPTAVVCGTPLYMAPELFAGGPIDPRADLYALGVLLYRLSTGREPFAGPGPARLMAQHLYERPPAPSEAAPGRVPPWLEGLILHLLRKDPAERPQSAEDVIRSLDRHEAAAPAPPQAEAERLEELRRYRILDTDPEQGFDDLTSLAAYVCGTPMAMISLIDADRQWFKSRLGLSLRETARNVSMCTHTIRQPDVLVVADAHHDERFANSPLVCGESQVRFYAGVPLVTAGGLALGALCVMDRAPRHLSPEQLAALTTLSRLVLAQLELRRNLLDLKDALANSRPQ